MEPGTSCEWESAGERCQFPGSISHSTTGGGPWYCRAHVDCANPVTGAAIVAQSRIPVPPSGERQARAERIEWLADHGLLPAGGEASGAYRERLRASIRVNAARLGRDKRAWIAQLAQRGERLSAMQESLLARATRGAIPAEPETVEF